MSSSASAFVAIDRSIPCEQNQKDTKTRKAKTRDRQQNIKLYSSSLAPESGCPESVLAKMFALTVSDLRDLRDLREKSRENDLQQTHKPKRKLKWITENVLTSASAPSPRM